MLDIFPTYLVVYLTAVVGLFGLVMGSALNCLALRITQGKKWSGSERSACPACGHVLTARELVPLFSWLCQKGRCRHCGAPVSPRYPLTEAGLALIYISIFLGYGLTVHTASLLVLVSCLFALSLVDLDTQIIPDRFLLIPAAVRLVEVLALEGPSALVSTVLPGLILGGGVLGLSLIMDRLLKKDTMGGGDIKLLALLGLYFPLPQCLLLLLLACVIGIAMAALLMKVDSETAFPFGPALALAAWLTLLVGEPIITWYLGLFR